MSTTDRATVLTTLETAYLAVRDAMGALRPCRLHGRADADHQVRHAHLQAVLDSLRAEVLQRQDET